MQKFIILILIFLLWLYSLLLFRKTKMNFFKFLFGSIGFFTINMIFFVPYLERVLNVLISDTLGIIASLTGQFEVFKNNSIISITTRESILSIFINYECSGIIEMLVFTSLALFFPFGGNIQKLLVTAAGNIYIFIANIARVLFIVLVTKTLGASAFYLAHTLFARLLFFGLMVALYYYVFTKTHLKHQNVGELQ